MQVILPLLCMTFLSNNVEAHRHLARGGTQKHVLVILVPEHLVQVCVPVLETPLVQSALPQSVLTL